MLLSDVQGKDRIAKSMAVVLSSANLGPSGLSPYEIGILYISSSIRRFDCFCHETAPGS